ncbi:hypothetical protein BC940DRAFT_315921 [Gongronella butleri]|nr:hypothetical protein BC940DRAFT_315921 [Gongronella butleri]
MSQALNSHAPPYQQAFQPPPQAYQRDFHQNDYSQPYAPFPQQMYPQSSAYSPYQQQYNAPTPHGAGYGYMPAPPAPVNEQQQQQQLQQQQQQAIGAPSSAARKVVAYDDIEAQQPKGRTCCDRWYKSDLAYQQHCKQHIKCEQCDYQAIPVCMTNHLAEKHGVGNLPKKKQDGIVPAGAPKLKTQQEIDAWIQARKKNWPSAANVERKEREAADRAARGELPLRANKRRRTEPLSTKEAKNTQKTPTVAAPAGLVDYVASDDDDNDNDNDDDTMDFDADAITSKDPNAMGKLPEQQDTPRKLICKYFMRGQCRHGKNCRFSHERPAKQPASGRVDTFRKRPQLLRLLLEDEIRNETSVILQCLRYISEKQFFGIGSTPVASTTADPGNNETKSDPLPKISVIDNEQEASSIASATEQASTDAIQ